MLIKKSKTIYRSLSISYHDSDTTDWQSYSGTYSNEFISVKFYGNNAKGLGEERTPVTIFEARFNGHIYEHGIEKYFESEHGLTMACMKVARAVLKEIKKDIVDKVAKATNFMLK